MKTDKYKNYFLLIMKIISIPFIFFYITMIIIFTIFYQDLNILKYTTHLTILIVALAYSQKLENKYLNALATITFLQFYFIDFGVHLVLAIVQTIIILLKTPYSMRAILLGFIFWLLYMFLFDDVWRIAGVMLIQISDRSLFTVSVIYLVFMSTVIVCVVKRKEHCLIIEKELQVIMSHE